MARDEEYTRQYSICRKFASTGACNKANCIFSHTLVDTARILALVGDFSAVPSQDPSASSETILFLIEYTKYSARDSTLPLEDEGQGSQVHETTWRMRLQGGGRATLATLGQPTGVAVESISVQPSYPVKGQAAMASSALTALEAKVFGASPAADPVRQTICKAHLTVPSTCHRGASCTFSHTLFDTARVEALLDEAVKSRGYGDLRPVLEIEYVYVQGPGVAGNAVWRVTLRCVVSYQKNTPQPVVATSRELGTAMRLLEGQFAAGASGSGGSPSPQKSRKPQPQSPNHRRNNSNPNANASPHSGGGRRRGRARHSNSHARAASASNSRNSTPAPAPEAGTGTAGPVDFPSRPAGPPPSYHDAMGMGAGAGPSPPSGGGAGFGFASGASSKLRRG